MERDPNGNFFSEELKQRIFACEPGQDFPKVFVDGLLERLKDRPPEFAPRISIYLNTRRMQRRMEELLHAAELGLLPRLHLITDLANEVVTPAIGNPISDMQRLFELRQLVAKLIEIAPEIAPKSAATDLADSLVKLLDEFSDAGITTEALGKLDVQDQSGHWQRSLQFLDVIQPFCRAENSAAFGAVARFRKVAEQLVDKWRARPFDEIRIIAGSTGSRGTTSLLMQAMVQQTNCALVLPGFDFEQPNSVWQALAKPEPVEDHPQYRFAKLIGELGLQPGDIQHWHGKATEPVQARNKIVSLALRPAPVTDQWLSEAPALQNIVSATKDIALLEAPNQDTEATSIALVMRHAIEMQKSVALVTPDQALTRMVSAKLDRWQIEPDASIGDDLAQSPPGRLMRACLAIGSRRTEAATFLALLKHPLVAKGSDRNHHMLQTRGLEKWVRQENVPFIHPQILGNWQRAREDLVNVKWLEWVKSHIAEPPPSAGGLEAHLTWHIQTAESLVAGFQQDASPAELWQEKAGEALDAFVIQLRKTSDSAGHLSRADYREVFDRLASEQEVREPVQPRSDVLIWGPMEARAQGADLVILGGLNDGTWPELPGPDPWLNRTMRKEIGLLLPERRVGLSAHDFQQAIGAPQVILSRSMRDADADTVPSRWINRLTNLLSGVGEVGKTALADMRSRGQEWVRLAALIDMPSSEQPAAPRPAPAPPAPSRPRKLSVTNIRNLIRDPYAIYAQKILGLKKIDPFTAAPDARLRGIAMHKVLEISNNDFDTNAGNAEQIAQLLGVADNVFDNGVPWPEIRALWQGKLNKISGKLVTDEVNRRTDVHRIVVEKKGSLLFQDLDVTVTAKADRIDILGDGSLGIFDYKSSVPRPIDLQDYEKQLFIEALIASYGSFENVPKAPISKVGYIGFNSKADTRDLELPKIDLGQVRAELETLLTTFMQDDQPYMSRRWMDDKFSGDYDHLARYGEWDEADEPFVVVVK